MNDKKDDKETSKEQNAKESSNEVHLPPIPSWGAYAYAQRVSAMSKEQFAAHRKEQKKEMQDLNDKIDKSNEERVKSQKKKEK